MTTIQPVIVSKPRLSATLVFFFSLIQGIATPVFADAPITATDEKVCADLRMLHEMGTKDPQSREVYFLTSHAWNLSEHEKVENAKHGYIEIDIQRASNTHEKTRKNLPPYLYSGVGLGNYIKPMLSFQEVRRIEFFEGLRYFYGENRGALIKALGQSGSANSVASAAVRATPAEMKACTRFVASRGAPFIPTSIVFESALMGAALFLTPISTGTDADPATYYARDLDRLFRDPVRNGLSGASIETQCKSALRKIRESDKLDKNPIYKSDYVIDNRNRTIDGFHQKVQEMTEDFRRNLARDQDVVCATPAPPSNTIDQEVSGSKVTSPSSAQNPPAHSVQPDPKGVRVK